MKIGHIEIFVKDPLQAKDFYVKVLGFELVEVQTEKFVWLKSGDNLFLLRPGRNDLQVNEYMNSNTGIVFYTDELSKTRDELILRGLEFKGTDGSKDCLTFTDLDGNWFQLVNPNHS